MHAPIIPLPTAQREERPTLGKPRVPTNPQEVASSVRTIKPASAAGPPRLPGPVRPWPEYANRLIGPAERDRLL